MPRIAALMRFSVLLMPPCRERWGQAHVRGEVEKKVKKKKCGVGAPSSTKRCALRMPSSTYIRGTRSLTPAT